MKRCPLGPTPQRVSPVARFRSAEEAWFWFVRCHQLRRAGGRMQRAVSAAARPCDPDDIYRWVKALRHARRIGAAHLATLERYGLAGRTPDPRLGSEIADARRWDEALDRLSTVLAARGALEP